MWRAVGGPLEGEEEPCWGAVVGMLAGRGRWFYSRSSRAPSYTYEKGMVSWFGSRPRGYLEESRAGGGV